MNKSFVLGGIIGFFASFIDKVKSIIKDFRSILIQHDILYIGYSTAFASLIKNKKLILLHKFRDEYIFTQLFMDENNISMFTPTIHDYHGFVLINSGNRLLDKITNIFYLSCDNILDNKEIHIYYFRWFRIRDKLFNLFAELNDNLVIKRSYRPDNFYITRIKSIQKDLREAPAANPAEMKPNTSKFPQYLFYDPVLYYPFINVYKSTINVLERRYRSYEDYVKHVYPFFHINDTVKYVLNLISTWKICNSLCDSVRTKMSILLYGPPGTGKSMMVNILGMLINTSIVVVDLLAVDESSLITALDKYLKYSHIILFEDIDVYFDYYRNNKQNMSLYGHNIIQPSTFLNIIDGIDKSSKAFLIFTTNYPEKIDERMIRVIDNKPIATRPGRIDECIYVGYVDENAIQYVVKSMCHAYNNLSMFKRLNIRLDDNDMMKYVPKTDKLTYAILINSCNKYIVDFVKDLPDDIKTKLRHM